MIDHHDPRHRWYTKDEAAEAVGVTLRTINRWINAGHLTPRLGHINAAQLFDVEHQQRRQRITAGTRRGPQLRHLTTVS